MDEKNKNNYHYLKQGLQSSEEILQDEEKTTPKRYADIMVCGLILSEQKYKNMSEIDPIVERLNQSIEKMKEKLNIK